MRTRVFLETQSPFERGLYAVVALAMLGLLVGQLFVQTNWQVYHTATDPYNAPGTLISDRYASNQWAVGFLTAFRLLWPIALFALLRFPSPYWVPLTVTIAACFLLVADLYVFVSYLVWAFTCFNSSDNPCADGRLCSQPREYNRPGTRCPTPGTPWVTPVPTNAIGADGSFVAGLIIVLLHTALAIIVIYFLVWKNFRRLPGPRGRAE